MRAAKWSSAGARELVPELLSTLSLCRSSTGLEVARAVAPVPEPGALLTSLAALFASTALRRARRRA